MKDLKNFSKKKHLQGASKKFRHAPRELFPLVPREKVFFIEKIGLKTKRKNFSRGTKGQISLGACRNFFAAPCTIPNHHSGALHQLILLSFPLPINSIPHELLGIKCNRYHQTQLLSSLS
jgi:hypothetical protein